jgi:hypothetical protein
VENLKVAENAAKRIRGEAAWPASRISGRQRSVDSTSSRFLRRVDKFNSVKSRQEIKKDDEKRRRGLAESEDIIKA